MLDLERLGDPDYLRGLLGKKVHFLGKTHCVVEILHDGPQLVLQNECNNVIQDNAYGRAYRRVHQTTLVPIFVRPGVLNPDLDTLSLAG